MRTKLAKIAGSLMTAGILPLFLSACESSGGYRISSVGLQGPQGIQGETGATGSAGADGTNGSAGAGGSAGADGTAGAGGSSGANGLNGLPAGTSAVATGGLVGSGGVAGTGLLANTGDPSNRSPASRVLVAGGTRTSALATRGTPLSERLDGTLTGNSSITGRVVQVMNNTGQALVRTGNGQEYLVDGLAAAPGQLVTVNAQDQRIVGNNGGQPLIAASALAPTASRGDAVTLGAGNQDRAVTVGSSATTSVAAPTAQPAANPLANPVQQVTGAVQPTVGSLIPRGN